jgi:hypothetical protein
MKSSAFTRFLNRWRLLPGMAVLVAAPECGDRVVGGRPNREGVITLRVGEHATFGPQRAEIGFQRVTGDSRCPTRVVCVWQGEAGVRLWTLLPPADSAFVELTLPGASGSETEPLGTSGYQVTAVRLDPYPERPAPIPASDYVVTLKLERRR